MTKDNFLLNVIIVMLFSSCFFREESTYRKYTLINSTNSEIRIQGDSISTFYGPVIIRANSSFVLDEGSEGGCINSGNLFDYYRSFDSLQVWYDDTILIKHLDNKFGGGASRSLLNIGLWEFEESEPKRGLCEHYECFTFTKEDYQEALAKHK